MSAYSYLKSQIAAIIRNNGNREITGDKLQTELFRLIDATGSLELVDKAMTVDEPSPVTSDKPLMYLAGEKGTYTNFGGIVVTMDVAFICWDGDSWSVVQSNTLQLGEVSTTAYRGDRGKTAFDHSQSTHAPADATNYTDAMADIRVASGISIKENSSNKVTTLSSASTDIEFPSAKAVYDNTTSVKYIIIGVNMDCPYFGQSPSQWGVILDINIDRVEESTNEIRLYTNTEQDTLTIDVLSNNFWLISLSSNFIKSISTNAFENATSLVSVNMPMCETISPSCFKSSSVQFVFMPKLSAVPDSSFQNAAQLLSITLGACSTIGSSSFGGCTDLVQLNSLGSGEMSSLTSVDGYAFANCSGLTTFNAPMLSSCGNAILYNCANLVTVTMSNLVTAGSHVFFGCSSLVNINLPLVQTIGDHFFDGCTSLCKVSMISIESLGSSVIDNSIFNGITTIHDIFVPTPLATCNEGNPDGDILYAAAHNSSMTIHYTV